MANSTKDKITADLKDLFSAAQMQLSEGLNVTMNSVRSQCFTKFEELGGLPEHTEAYKYLNMLPIYAEDYAISFKPLFPQTDIKELFRCAVPGLVSVPIIVFNGWFHKDNKVNLPNGVICCSMSEAENLCPEIFKKHYNKHISDDPLTLLNGAFAQDGLFIYIPDNVVVETPIQIINLLQANGNLMAYQRNLIVLGNNAQATILACDHTLTDTKFLMNNVTEFVTGINSHADYLQIQSQNAKTSLINTICADQYSSSNFQSTILSLYGGTIRNNQFVTFRGEGAHCDLYGCYILGQEQCTDNYTYIDHTVPNCSSNELFKGVMDGHSLGNFTGCIRVRPDAQKTESYQSNNNLLLTNDAKVNTKPQLIIDADDVKCSHGATVGQIDQEAMFYLRSRGIGADEARMMMMAAFAHDIVRRVKLEPIRNKVAGMVDKRLRGEGSTCGNCKMVCNKQ